jgi:transposase
MSLRASEVGAVPEQTAQIARAAFRKGNACLRLRDELGPVFEDAMFTSLYAPRGQPGYAPWRLALVTVLQFADGLSDRQAAEAVRGRIDWKYLLGLELTDPGFDYSILCEFRARLLAGGLEMRLLDALLERARAAQLLKPGGRQRTDSTHVLAAVRDVNRLELRVEMLRAALNALAAAAPDWLVGQIPPAAGWRERYGARAEAFRLPKGETARRALALAVGADGYRLLAALWTAAAPPDLRRLPAVDRLRQLWVEHYYLDPRERVHDRSAEALGEPPARRRLASPYDGEARSADKRRVQWLGYKVHLTETCEAALPHLIVDVLTVAAPVPDREAVPAVQAALDRRGLRPDAQLVDGGYIDGGVLAASRAARPALDLVGPVGPDRSWQAKANQGYAAAAFRFDWVAKTATCPEGRTSVAWWPGPDKYGAPMIHIRFEAADCRACPARERCTRGPGRSLAVRPQPESAAMQAMRARQADETAWAKLYNPRAGIEGTLGEAVRTCGLRRARYIGLAKTRLQHLASAAALNFRRLDAWWADRPCAKTRTSRFAALAPA